RMLKIRTSGAGTSFGDKPRGRAVRSVIDRVQWVFARVPRVVRYSMVGFPIERRGMSDGSGSGARNQHVDVRSESPPHRELYYRRGGGGGGGPVALVVAAAPRHLAGDAADAGRGRDRVVLAGWRGTRSARDRDGGLRDRRHQRPAGRPGGADQPTGAIRLAGAA